jgi:thiamine-monophosphate kinase
VAHAAERFGVAVAGGDITAAERLFVSVSVVGEAREEDVVYRSGARPGDLLCVTGDLGGAAAGLKTLLGEKDTFLANDAQPELQEWSYAIERHLAPRPRLDLVVAWREAGFLPHALIDISDGLASETHHICRASGTGARLDASLLPLHIQTVRAAKRFGDNPMTYALFGGEDYELLFAAPESTLSLLRDDSHAIVGEVTDAQEGVTLRLPDGEAVPLEARGFQHF